MNNLVSQFLLATIVLSGFATSAIVAVEYIRPEHDNSAIIATIVSVSAPTLFALAAFLRSQANAQQVTAVEKKQDTKAEDIKKALAEANENVKSRLTDQDKAIAEVKDVVVQTTSDVRKSITESKIQ